MTPAPDSPDPGVPDSGADGGPRSGPRSGAGDREPDEGPPGLAMERTMLAWTRTAISFAALGGAVLKQNVVTGLIILAMAPLIWQLGRVYHAGPADAGQPPVGTRRIQLITVSIVAVSLLSLLVALLNRSAPGALR